MAEYGENFRAGRIKVMCPFCNLHLDSQDLGYICPIIQANIDISGSYTDIYSENITQRTMETIERMSEYRKHNLPTGPK